MYKLLGLKQNLNNLAALSKPYLPPNASKNDLKIAYKAFLKKAQPLVPQTDFTDISFLYKFEEITPLLKLFEEDSILDDFKEIFDQLDHTAQNFPQSRIQETCRIMKETSPDFCELMNLAINTIFSAPSALAGGGSTSAAIGCIWVNLRDHWDKQDVFEFLVHETTHNLVFLDELCYGHYSDYSQLPINENYSWSAILNKLRPLDKVFHSIVVSTEVLLFREETLGHPSKPCLHPPTHIMLEQALYSIRYLNDHSHLKNLLSKRANYLLESCECALKTLESSILTKNLRCV